MPRSPSSRDLPLLDYANQMAAKQAGMKSCLAPLLYLAILGVVVTLGLIWYVKSNKLISTIDFPDGAQLRLYYRPDDNLLFAAAGIGGVDYRIDRAGNRIAAGKLTESGYDMQIDVELSHTVVSGSEILLSEAKTESRWRIRSTGSVQALPKP